MLLPTMLHAVVAAAAAVSPKKQPHICFFLIDDYGHSDIGYHNELNEGLLRTPNLDALASAGVKLESYYVQPICTPTRSQLLSGRYQIHTGLQHGVIHPMEPYGLPVSIPLLSNRLFSLGYRNHKVGKWHLGFYTNASTPWERGFGPAEGSDFGYLGGMEDYWTKMRDPGLDFRNNSIICYNCTTTDKNGDPAKYSTKLFRLRAEEKIEEHAAKYAAQPMFLYMPFQAVHGPLDSSPHWQSMFNKADFDGNEDRFTMAAMVVEMDFAVGKVVDAFKDNNAMYNNTVFILSADNGGLHTAGGYNYPLRGEKNTLWEGGVKAVGFVHSALLPPSVVGKVYSGLVHVSDWFPTLLQLAAAGATGGGLVREREGGVKAAREDGLDGFDVWMAITTNGTSPRTELLHNIDILADSATGSRGFGNAAIRMGSYKLIVGNVVGGRGELNVTHFVAPGCNATRCPALTPSSDTITDSNHTVNINRKSNVDGRHYSLRAAAAAAGGKCAGDTNTTDTWLFNIAADPYELCNLAKSLPEQVERMVERLAFYNTTAVPPLNANITDDPAADPASRTGSFTPKGCWGPWR